MTEKSKTSMWLEHYELTLYICDNCGNTSENKDEYCSNCGAKMLKELKQ